MQRFDKSGEDSLRLRYFFKIQSKIDRRYSRNLKRDLGSS